MIPHNKPTMGKEEERAAARVLRSGWVAEGKEVERFENALCAHLGLPTGHAVAVSSGTAALYLSLVSLGVKGGDEVLVPTYVCSAVLNAVFMTGAVPVLADVDRETLNLSAAEAQKKITDKTRAIIVTHTFGMPVDILQFASLNIPVIEDCAQAIGARINDVPVGTSGALAIFSFYATKMITSGYGGMVVSKDSAVIERIRDYRQFDGRKEYKRRFNFQLSDVNAAVGVEQMKKLPKFLKRRTTIQKLYRKLLPAQLQLWPALNAASQPNFYRVLLKTDRAHDLQLFLKEKEVSTIIPIEEFELLHRYLHQDPAAFPVAEWAAQSLLSLPAYPSLTDTQVRSIAREIKAFFSL